MKNFDSTTKEIDELDSILNVLKYTPKVFVVVNQAGEYHEILEKAESFKELCYPSSYKLITCIPVGMILKIVEIAKKNAKAEFCEDLAEDYFYDAGIGSVEGDSVETIQKAMDMGNFWAERAKQERNRE